ncbi:conserved hypothetical protein [Photorhabdus asymbiotica]|uniref:Uncharacterized protein n=2 Tax=Photorhabdus asymbiotica TaxID=291112 RepID=B6VLN0_PHOAA|nr:conserved hypothetical protein [Photorhabdus asymbiotica]CAR67060.1 Conserved Hypothetical Protein [Photorhabdus asymbiotica subsp. asymbiotica ATCC 43949]
MIRSSTSPFHPSYIGGFLSHSLSQTKNSLGFPKQAVPYICQFNNSLIPMKPLYTKLLFKDSNGIGNSKYGQTQETMALLKILALGQQQVKTGEVTPVKDAVQRLKNKGKFT